MVGEFIKPCHHIIHRVTLLPYNTSSKTVIKAIEVLFPQRQVYWEEPPQNPNKSAKKYSFFVGIFTWLKTKLKNCWSDIALHGNVRAGEVSDWKHYNWTQSSSQPWLSNREWFIIRTSNNLIFLNTVYTWYTWISKRKSCFESNFTHEMWFFCQAVG